MKKIFLTAGIITLLITGAGCANSSETNKQTPTATQQSRSSTTPAVNLSTAIEASPADFLKIQNKLNQGKKIIEVEKVPSFQLPPGIFIEQLWKLFQLDDIYFAVYIRQNSNFFGSTMPTGTVQSGILWAYKNESRWRKFFVVQDKSPDDFNNMIYLWNQDKKLHFLVQEPDRSASGFGLGRIFSSSDGGKLWRIDRCFFMSVGGKGILPAERPKKSELVIFQKYLYDNYIYRKPDNSPLITPDKRDIKFNSSTSKFELDFFDKEQNKIITQEIEECLNLILP